jgi:hypothetical protein
MAGRSRANHTAGEVDLSWQRFTRCRICGRRMCVNNNSTRTIDPPRKCGVVCCPWCTYEAAYCFVLVKRLAAAEDKEEIKILRKKARKFFAEGANQNHIARRSSGEKV